jgi:hypothetical protein
MCAKTCRLVIVFATASICLTNFGCLAFQNQALLPMHRAVLDEGRTVSLAYYVQDNAVLRGPDHNYAELRLFVESDKDGPMAGGVVARRGNTFGCEVESFQLGEVEARADDAREKVWLVDKEAQRVVATLDCATGATTGPDDQPPTWATLDGGVRLEPIESE